MRKLIPLAIVTLLLLLVVSSVWAATTFPTFFSTETQKRLRDWYSKDEWQALNSAFNDTKTYIDGRFSAGLDGTFSTITTTGDVNVGQNVYLEDGVWNGIQDGNVVFGDSNDATIMWFEDAVNGDRLDFSSDEHFFFNTGTATKTVEIVTGNLVVGNGSPDQTQDGEDTYLEGMLEVDGSAYFDGGVTITPTFTFSDFQFVVSDPVTFTDVLTNVRVLYYQVP